MTENNTENTVVPRPLSVLVKEHCGLDGETSGEFMREYKKLTDDDKADFRSEFEKMGIPVKQ